MTRMFGFTLFCALLAIGLWCSQPMPTEAQSKKDDHAKQIQQLKKSLADRDQQIARLRGELAEARRKNPGVPRLQKDLDAARRTIRDREADIAVLQDKSSRTDLEKENFALRKAVRDLSAVKKAPFVHTVILKLKKTDDAQVKKVYDEAVKTLAKIDGVRNVYIGKPAETDTPELAQKDYQLGLVVLLDDASALQKFLDDPQYKEFSDRLTDYWERPVVYDFQRDMDEKDEKKEKKDDPK